MGELFVCASNEKNLSNEKNVQNDDGDFITKTMYLGRL